MLRPPRILSLLSTGTAAVAMLAGLAAQDPAPARIPLRVLYAGSVDSARTDDFVRFLQSEFVGVGTTAFTSFDPGEAEGYDVVIFDCEIKPTERTIGVEKPPELPRSFDKPSVLIGGAGALIAERLELKSDWL